MAQVCRNEAAATNEASGAHTVWHQPRKFKARPMHALPYVGLQIVHTGLASIRGLFPCCKATATLSSSLYCIGFGLVWAGIYDPPTQSPSRYCLSKARAIFATVAAVGSARMAAAPPVEAAVVDEAAQLPEAHLAVPLALCGGGSLALLVLVGDPQQLPATVLSQVSALLVGWLVGWLVVRGVVQARDDV